MSIDVAETRSLAHYYRSKAMLLTGTEPTLAWYHTSLSLALAEIERLQGLLLEKTIASGKHLNLVDTTSGK